MAHYTKVTKEAVTKALSLKALWRTDECQIWDI